MTVGKVIAKKRPERAIKNKAPSPKTSPPVNRINAIVKEAITVLKLPNLSTTKPPKSLPKANIKKKVDKYIEASFSL